MLKSDAGQTVLKFVAKVQSKPADDPFIEWLRDDKSVRIDWGTFGIKQLKSE